MTTLMQQNILVVLLLLFGSSMVPSVYYFLMGRKAKSGTLALTASSLNAALSVLLLISFWGAPELTVQGTWFTIANRPFNIGFLINKLSLSMLSLVHVIALPVFIYSVGYMAKDGRIHRYWLYLSFFCFSMMGLVLSSNLLMTYIFWEFVGITSFLLIGFWYKKSAAAKASKKAFLINRIGDVGLLVGLASLYSVFGTLEIQEIFGSSGLLSDLQQSTEGLPTALTWASFGFLIAAMAKSAQFPLHVWLPDAMQGPTAVSSLIHAATMVAAGVFLLCLTFPLYSSGFLEIVALVGTATAFIGAYSALQENNIKKILAYSTVSQLGYMVAAVGFGAPSAALLHLFTHAFFKCMLFLGAGATIKYMNEHTQAKDPQDIREMGGLKNKIPLVFVLMVVASFALIGLPLTSGYLSKEAIILSGLASGNSLGLLLPSLLIITSLITAYYVARLFFMTFFGTSRHESLTVPAGGNSSLRIMSLTPCALILGCLFNLFSKSPGGFENSWVYTILPYQSADLKAGLSQVLVPILMVAGSLLILLATYYYIVVNRAGKVNTIAASTFNKVKPSGPSLWKTLVRNTCQAASWLEAHLIDGILVYGATGLFKTAKGVKWIETHLIDGITRLIASFTLIASKTANWADIHIVDGIVNGTGRIAKQTGNTFRSQQNGKLQHYLSLVLFFLLFGLIYFILKR